MNISDLFLYEQRYRKNKITSAEMKTTLRRNCGKRMNGEGYEPQLFL
jgi:hypothetical protein